MWKHIVHSSLFEVNEFGVVRNSNTHYVITQRMNKQGYLYVQLTFDNKNHCFLVHRLVAEAFIPNPDNLPIVNHIDECCVHNSADNLEWISYKGNSNHGTRNARIVRDRKIPIIGFHENGITEFRFSSRYDAARDLGVSEHAVRAAMKNHNKCKGLYWREAKDESPEQESQTNIEWIENKRIIKEEQKLLSYSRGPVAVSAINCDGEKQFVFSSISEAAKAMNVSGSAISAAIHKKTKCKSLNWIVER